MKLHEKNEVCDAGLLNDRRPASPLRLMDQAMVMPDGKSRWWRRLMAGGAMAALLAPGFASAQLQPAFVVNTTTAGNQRFPDIATDPAGNFTIVWTGPDGDGAGIFARRFSADGTPLGAEFRVNTAIAGAFAIPSVAMDAQGRFVVAYAAPDADGNGIYARRYAASGAALDAAPFRVNVGTAGDQGEPDVAAAPDGAMVIAWHEVFPDQDLLERVSFRLFAANGRPITGDVVVATSEGDSNDDQFGISAAMQTDGSFVIVHEDSTRFDTSGGVIVAGFSPTGELLQGSYGLRSSGHFNPSLSTAGSGYVLAADDSFNDSDEDVAYVKRLDARGLPLDPELAVTDPRVSNAEYAIVAGTPSGQLAVVAKVRPVEFGPALSGTLYGRRYSAENLPLAAATPLDVPALGYAPAISLAANGNGIVVWTNGHGGFHGLDGDQGGIVARQFTVSP